MTDRLLACYLVPFCLGLGIGVWRARQPLDRRRGGGGLRIVGGIVGFVATVLTGLILLAKLFDSNVLGWMFGLGLMLVFLAMPCAVLFAVGALIGGSFGRSPIFGARVANGDADAATFAIAIDRGSVHASDDEGHVAVRTVRPDLPLSLLLQQLRDDRYLPSIRGGKATWVVESSGHAGKPIAVIAEQWDAPRLDVPDLSVARHFAGVRPALYVDYRAQVDPTAVLSTPGSWPRRVFA